LLAGKKIYRKKNLIFSVEKARKNGRKKTGRKQEVNRMWRGNKHHNTRGFKKYKQTYPKHSILQCCGSGSVGTV
jgi:hypothetical protein